MLKRFSVSVSCIIISSSLEEICKIQAPVHYLLLAYMPHSCEMDNYQVYKIHIQSITSLTSFSLWSYEYILITDKVEITSLLLQYYGLRFLTCSGKIWIAFYAWLREKGKLYIAENCRQTGYFTGVTTKWRVNNERYLCQWTRHQQTSSKSSSCNCMRCTMLRSQHGWHAGCSDVEAKLTNWL